MAARAPVILPQPAMSVRADLRRDDARCRRCGAPLADAPEIRRTWRTIRSGEWIGCRGEFVLLACGTCGELRRQLWTVRMAPYPGRAA